MEQIERIKTMERHMDEATAALRAMEQALEKYHRAQTSFEKLTRYYESRDWRADREVDEAGLLPDDLKRGVLSEDGLWNLLADRRELEDEMSEMTNRKQIDDFA